MAINFEPTEASITPRPAKAILYDQRLTRLMMPITSSAELLREQPTASDRLLSGSGGNGPHKCGRVP